jgi:hypothetical protein
MAKPMSDEPLSPTTGAALAPPRAKVDLAFGLTARQLAWCREYLICGHAGKAALAAGYAVTAASHMGSELRRHAGCRAWLAYHDDGTYRALQKKRKLVRSLWRNDKLAIEGHPITDKNGSVVGTKRDITASNRALELIGKVEGVLTDKVEHSGKIDLLGSIREAYAEHTSRRGVVDADLVRDGDRRAMEEFYGPPPPLDDDK